MVIIRLGITTYIALYGKNDCPNFCLISPQSIFPNIKMSSGKANKSLYVLVAQKWFWSWNSTMQAIFSPSRFILAESCTCPCCALRVILVSWPLLGELATIFHHLWSKAITVVCWSPKASQLSSVWGCFGLPCFVRQVRFKWFLKWEQVWP